MESDSCKILVDSGASAHVVLDLKKFIRTDKNFVPKKHFMELADGSQSNDVVVAKGDANYTLCDSNGQKHDVILKNALCIPSYTQDIFSVRKATEQGSSIKFTPQGSYLSTPDGCKFNFVSNGKLYFMNSVKSVNSQSRSLEDWHKAFGHCNTKDLLKLESVVEGMKIGNKSDFKCDTCIENKMTNTINRDPDERAKVPLELVQLGAMKRTSIEYFLENYFRHMNACRGTSFI